MIQKIEIRATLDLDAGVLRLESPAPLPATHTIGLTLPPPYNNERRTPGNLRQEATDWARKLFDGNIALDHEHGWRVAEEGFGVWVRTAYIA